MEQYTYNKTRHDAFMSRLPDGVMRPLVEKLIAEATRLGMTVTRRVNFFDPIRKSPGGEDWSVHHTADIPETGNVATRVTGMTVAWTGEMGKTRACKAYRNLLPLLTYLQSLPTPTDTPPPDAIIRVHIDATTSNREANLFEIVEAPPGVDTGVVPLLDIADMPEFITGLLLNGHTTVLTVREEHTDPNWIQAYMPD